MKTKALKTVILKNLTTWHSYSISGPEREHTSISYSHDEKVINRIIYHIIFFPSGNLTKTLQSCIAFYFDIR